MQDITRACLHAQLSYMSSCMFSCLPAQLSYMHGLFVHYTLHVLGPQALILVHGLCMKSLGQPRAGLVGDMQRERDLGTHARKSW